MMTERGLAQEDIEASTGISQTSLSRLFTGTRSHPSFAMIVQVARAIGAPLNEVAGITGDAAVDSADIAVEKRLRRLALKVARLEAIVLRSWEVASEAARERVEAEPIRVTRGRASKKTGAKKKKR